MEVDIDYIAIGKRIRSARLAKKMTQETLSNMIDVTPTYISTIDDDDGITHLHLAGCCTIQTDTTAATLTLDDVGLQALAIIVIHNLHLLSCYQVSCIHQILIYRDATHVIQVSLSYSHTMELTLQYFNLHCSVITFIYYGLNLIKKSIEELSFILDMVDETDRSLAAIYGDATYHVCTILP